MTIIEQTPENKMPTVVGTYRVFGQGIAYVTVAAPPDISVGDVVARLDRIRAERRDVGHNGFLGEYIADDTYGLRFVWSHYPPSRTHPVGLAQGHLSPWDWRRAGDVDPNMTVAAYLECLRAEELAEGRHGR